MIHFHDKRPTAKPVTDANKVRVWCGRETMNATNRLTEVSCQQCRANFAAALRQLPDVDQNRS